MTNRLKISSFFIILFLSAACSSNPTSSSSEKFEDVPKGEIVSVDMRDETLTGIKPGSSNKEISAVDSQKWWLQIISKVDYSDCEGYEDQDITQDNVYYGFKPGGSLYIKQGESGSEQYVTSWEWADDSKSAIIIETFPDVEFELTALNDDEVIYASQQEFEGGCKAVTWEQFGDPISD